MSDAPQRTNRATVSSPSTLPIREATPSSPIPLRDRNPLEIVAAEALLLLKMQRGPGDLRRQTDDNESGSKIEQKGNLDRQIEYLECRTAVLESKAEPCSGRITRSRSRRNFAEEENHGHSRRATDRSASTSNLVVQQNPRRRSQRLIEKVAAKAQVKVEEEDEQVLAPKAQFSLQDFQEEEEEIEEAEYSFAEYDG